MKKILLFTAMIVALGSCTADEILNETAVQVCQGFARDNYNSLIEDATTDEEKAELLSELNAALLACEKNI